MKNEEIKKQNTKKIINVILATGIIAGIALGSIAIIQNNNDQDYITINERRWNNIYPMDPTNPELSSEVVKAIKLVANNTDEVVKLVKFAVDNTGEHVNPMDPTNPELPSKVVNAIKLVANNTGENVNPMDPTFPGLRNMIINLYHNNIALTNTYNFAGGLEVTVKADWVNDEITTTWTSTDKHNVYLANNSNNTLNGDYDLNDNQDHFDNDALMIGQDTDYIVSSTFDVDNTTSWLTKDNTIRLIPSHDQDYYIDANDNGVFNDKNKVAEHFVFSEEAMNGIIVDFNNNTIDLYNK